MVNNMLEQDTISKVLTPSAFVLIKTSQSMEFMDTYKELDSCEYKITCDAVKGDYDIILSYASGSADKTEAIYKDDLRTFEAITRSEFLTLTEPPLEPKVKELLASSGYIFSSEMNTERGDNKKVHSYLLINADTSKLNTLFPLLVLDEKVLYCGYTSGVYNLLMFVSGKQFSDIDKLISKKIMNIDGILKVKEYPVINIYNL